MSNLMLISWQKHSFEGYELLTPRVDTVELSQLFFPTFEKYSLGNLAEHLELGLDQAHTAISDAMATARLLIKIQEKIKSLPRSIVEKILDLADNLLFESRLVIDEMVPVLSENLSYDLESIHDLVLKSQKKSSQPTDYLKIFRPILPFSACMNEKQTAFAQVVEKRLVDEEKCILFKRRQVWGRLTVISCLYLLSQTSLYWSPYRPSSFKSRLWKRKGASLKRYFVFP